MSYEIAPISIRFKNWGHEVSEVEREFFKKLFEKAFYRKVAVVESDKPYVDVQIESFYNGKITPDLSTRAYRFLKSNLPGGINFNNPKFSVNQQPEKNSKYSVFCTLENVRPPEGNWDAYLSYDLHSFAGRNSYLPLWWITSTDLLFPKISPYLGKEISIKDLIAPRNTIGQYDKRNKFCAAFIGKAYPLRMHAISALSKIGKVDVFGAVSRSSNTRKTISKFEISKNYRFVFAFENDFYPGYVTEKAPEAWATGAVPLYWGLDSSGYINQDSLINLANFKNLDLFIDRVKQVNNSKKLWERYSSEPFLRKAPTLDNVLSNLRSNLVTLNRQK
ncbi:MAG: hypothetical protein GM48_0140 [actinobacterium acIB-AMD-7]|nr:MAG: hypothetical protein GM48_0140 [actinobacterium acIB-AMD-7]